jgi:hypothetical protein
MRLAEWLRALQNLVKTMFMRTRKSQVDDEHYQKVFLATFGDEEAISNKSKNLIAEQLALNEQAWETLQQNGVGEDDEFCLNFKFNAPNHAYSEALKDYISRKTDYAVLTTTAGSYGKGSVVQGTTKPVKISKTMLDLWVCEMVKLGMQHDCSFNGWWIWKYDKFARPGAPGVRQQIGSIAEGKSNFIKWLAEMITGKRKDKIS